MKAIRIKAGPLEVVEAEAARITSQAVDAGMKANVRIFGTSGGKWKGEIVLTKMEAA